MKQLVPTGIEEYAERKEGDVVSGRVIEISGGQARVELGEGIHAACRIPTTKVSSEKDAPAAKSDLSSLTFMLQARWKGSAAAGPAKPEEIGAGQVRSFRITKLDTAAKKIELELA
jgi:small subunit ribosomal protein S1